MMESSSKRKLPDLGGEVQKGRSRETGGTGLGLAIVKHVLRRNGGELRIRSTPGKGSAFTFRFPEERIFVPQSL